MNKYLVYTWSYIHNSYWPFASAPSLAVARSLIRYLGFHTASFIVVPNPHSRYAQNP